MIIYFNSIQSNQVVNQKHEINDFSLFEEEENKAASTADHDKMQFKCGFDLRSLAFDRILI